MGAKERLEVRLYEIGSAGGDLSWSSRQRN
jgi:hypothetical protein